jgi:hypothetical protein
MQQTDSTEASREETFAQAPGGKEIIAWFGFAPSFHDATLKSLTLAANAATIVLAAFRMTSEVDANGYFVVDRHAHVTIELDEVSGVVLNGSADAIISELRVRRLTAPSGTWHSVAGPEAGDFEVAWDSSYGLEGALYARTVRFVLEPA